MVVTGEHNLYDYVQASAEDVEIYNILDRFTRGDFTALMQKKGQFLDVTGMPSTLAEAQQLMINATVKFNSLPKDVRNQFNDVTDYINKVATSDLAGLKEIFGVTSTHKASTEDIGGDVENA